jgi:hypothetical protein
MSLGMPVSSNYMKIASFAALVLFQLLKSFGQLIASENTNYTAPVTFISFISRSMKGDSSKSNKFEASYPVGSAASIS